MKKLKGGVSRTETNIEATKRQLGEWKKETASREYRADCFALMAKLGTISRQEYLEGMIELDAKYPDRGWRQAADELERYYFEQGLSLKEKRRPEETQVSQQLSEMIREIRERAV